MNVPQSRRYIIFLDLPRVVQDKIDKVKKRLGSQSIKKWPAHITLKYDEEFLVAKAELSRMVRQFYKQVPKITVTLGAPTIVFVEKNDGWNINLPVLNKKEVSQVTKSFSKKIEPFIRKDVVGSMLSTRWEQSKSFAPHVSLKGGIGKKTAKEPYEKAQVQNFHLSFPVTFQCNSVTLAEWKNNKWSKVLRVKLKSDAVNA